MATPPDGRERTGAAKAARRITMELMVFIVTVSKENERRPGRGAGDVDSNEDTNGMVSNQE